MEFINRIRSKQSGHPSGLLGRVLGRVMVRHTGAANERAIELLQLSTPQTVLEVGFGQGATVAKLAELGHRVLGVDVSKTMVRQATARSREASVAGVVDLKVGDGQAIPFDDGQADSALSAHVIYFMPDPQATLTDIARVLKPGGRFVLACRVSDDETPEWMDPEVYRIPSIAAVGSMLANAGFASVKHHPGNEATRFAHWFVADLPD